MSQTENLDRMCVNTIRMLSADAVQAAGSGHPGMPMGAAPIAYVLWNRFLKHNPVALNGGLIPYGATFLIFSDYMRPPIRLAALMQLQVIYIFTHDSIGLGEDGPTHQPWNSLPL